MTTEPNPPAGDHTDDAGDSPAEQADLAVGYRQVLDDEAAAELGADDPNIAVCDDHPGDDLAAVTGEEVPDTLGVHAELAKLDQQGGDV